MICNPGILEMAQRFSVFIRALGFAIPLALISISIGLADDIFVDNVSGDDSRNGLADKEGSSNSGPVRSIGRALELVRTGDQIIVGDTGIPYRESLTIQGSRHDGVIGLPFRIISNGAVLDGTGPIPDNGWERVIGDTYRYQPTLKSHQVVYFNERPLPRGENWGSLEPMEWALSDGWIYFCTEPGRLPHTYDLSCCKHQTGITLYQCANVEIVGLVVQGFQLDGINAHDGTESVSIRRCKLRGNGRSGLSVGGASKIRFIESISGNNYVAQVRTESRGRVNIDACRLLQSALYGPATESVGGEILIDDSGVQ